MNTRGWFAGFVAAALMAAMVGCSSAPAPAPKEQAPVLRIGASISMSGALAKEGGYVRDGYEYWKDTVNAAGGIDVGGKKYKVEIKYLDDQSDPQTGAKLVEKLITEDNIKIVFGPYGSGQTKATSAVGEKYKVLTIASMANADSIYQAGMKYVFGIAPLASTQARPALQFAKENGVKTVAIVSPDDLWPLTVAEGAKKIAEGLGMEVAFFSTYPKGTQDLSGLVGQIKSKNPEMVVGTGNLNEIVLMTRQMKELKFNPKVLAFTGATGFPDYAKNLGADADGVLGLDWWTPATNWQGGVFKNAAEYAKGFQAKYNYVPSYVAAAGSAAGEILQMAIQKAGTVDDVEKIRQALLALDTCIFFGEFDFDETGANVKGGAAATQIGADGKFQVIWPKAIAERTGVFPKPAWSGQ